MPGGSRRLVMIDETASHRVLASSLGLQRTRWEGVWIGANDKFALPKNFTSVWSKAKIIQIDPIDHGEKFKKTLLLKKDSRLSQKSKKRFSWHPTEVATAAKTISEMFGEKPGVQEEKVEVKTLLNRSEFLGYNHLGQTIFEESLADSSGRPLRVAMFENNVVAKEKDGDIDSPVFLRSSNEDDLVLCAAGLVGEIEIGHLLTSGDFERYIEAIMGPNAEQNRTLIPKMQSAIDRASVQSLLRSGLGADGFRAALRLHEGRPPFWRETGSLPTPLPVSSILQSIVLDHVFSDGKTALEKRSDVDSNKTIIDIHPNESIGNTWGIPSIHSTSSDIRPHDAMVGGVFSSSIERANVSGISVSRSDHKAILDSLSMRSSDGISAFVIAGGDKIGKLDPEIKRVLSSVGSRYEIQGVVDLALQMIGHGNVTNSRILIIGKRRDSLLSGFSIPSEVPVYHDYESLFAWSNTVRGPSGQDFDFSGASVNENRWQAPYIPFSQVSEREAMSPRNLIGPVRKALSKLIDRTGMGIDEFVSSKLQIGIDDLGKILSSEQVDAVALAIQSIDAGRGFVLADQTGIGKGRTLAATAAYVKKIGKNVVFLTETAQLFRDFYRDIENIGSIDLFKKPLVFNSIKREQMVFSSDGSCLIKSAKPGDLKLALSSPGFPSDYDMIVSTYSQFNRKGATSSEVEFHYAAALAIKILKSGGSIDDAIMAAAVPLKIEFALSSKYLELNKDQCFTEIDSDFGQGLVSEEMSQILKKQVELRDEIKLGTVSDLEKRLESFSISPSSAKLALFNSKEALENTVVFFDEAHVAAGPESQTGKNLASAVDLSSAIMYSSSTFAKDTQNFGIFRRVFPNSINPERLAETINKGGEPLQEILCSMLAEDGRMIRREHDLSKVEFKNTSADMPELVDIYKERNIQWATSFSQVLSAMTLLTGELEVIANNMSVEAQNKLEAAIAATQTSHYTGTSKRVGVSLNNFSSQFYNLSRSFMMAARADICADLAIKSLNENRKPIIILENTMDSTLRALVDDVLNFTETVVDDLDDASVVDSDAMADTDDASLVSDSELKTAHLNSTEFSNRVSFKNVLKRYADKLFYAKEIVRDGRKVVDVKTLTIDTKEMAEAMVVINNLIDEMPEIPIAPIDLIVEKIKASGYSVGEVSRRSYSLVELGDGKQSIIRLAPRDFSRTIDGFNNGEIDCIILSKAGTTGISLHSDPSFKNINQREIIELQEAADVAKRQQGLGRGNRKGQVVPPIVRIVSSGLPCEMRQQAMQMAKERKLFAVTSGNADNSKLDDDTPDILNRVGSEVCFRLLESDPTLATELGINMDAYSDNDKAHLGSQFVNMFTNRITMLTPSRGEAVYDSLFKEFKSLVSQYEIEGRNPLKSDRLDINAARGTSIIIQESNGDEDSVFNNPVTATEITYRVKRQALDRQLILDEIMVSAGDLINNFGQNYQAEIRTMIEQETADRLPSLVGTGFLSVEDAIASEKGNRAKNFYASSTWLSSNISNFSPGNIFQITDDDTIGEIDTCVVVGLSVPTTNITSMSSYIVKVRSCLNRNVHSYPMSVLYNLGPKVQTKPRFFGAADKIDLWLAPLYKESDEKVTSVVLDSNLFGAAEISNQTSSGRAVVYTDNQKDPVSHFAIAMPRGYRLSDAANLPVELTDAKSFLTLFNEDPDKAIFISHTWQVKDQNYEIICSKNNMSITVRNWAVMSWLKTPEILDCLDGPITGSRGIRRASVLSDLSSEFIDNFIRLARCNGVPVKIPGRFRSRMNEVNKKIKDDAKLDVLSASSRQIGLDAIAARF